MKSTRVQGKGSIGRAVTPRPTTNVIPFHAPVGKKKKKASEEELTAKLEGTLSLFKKDYKKLKKMVGSEAADDYQHDKARAAILRSLLKMFLDILPDAEKSFRQYKNERAAYALVALVNTIRELQNDIGSINSLEQQVKHIKKEILWPQFPALVEHINGEIFDLKSLVDKTIKVESKKRKLHSQIDKFFHSVGSAIQTGVTKTFSELDEYLLK